MQIHVSKLRENKKKDSILIFSMKTKVITSQSTHFFVFGSLEGEECRK